MHQSSLLLNFLTVARTLYPKLIQVLRQIYYFHCLQVLGTVSLSQHVRAEQTQHCLQPFHFSSHSGGPARPQSFSLSFNQERSGSQSVSGYELFTGPFFYRETGPKTGLFTWNKSVFCKKTEFSTVKVS